MRYILKPVLFVALCLFSYLLQAAETRTLSSILASGELRVGLATFEPWTIKGKDGALVGSEVDIARRLAADMGLEVKLAVYDWNKLIDALNGGDIDIVVAGMAVTPSRALKVNFSQPYASSGIGVATNTALTKQFNSIKDMNSKSVKVAVVSGTVAEQIAKRLFGQAKIVEFSSSQLAQQAVVAGDVHGYVESIPGPDFLALRHPDKVDVPIETPLYSTREAFAVRKGDQDFVNFLNAWIVSRSADAWLESTRRYWFESLAWREQVQ